MILVKSPRSPRSFTDRKHISLKYSENQNQKNNIDLLNANKRHELIKMRRLPVHSAAYNDIPCLMRMLERGENINQQNRDGNTALMNCIILRSKNIYAVLNIPSINCNIQNHRGNTALHIAVIASRVDLVEPLVRFGALLNIIDSCGNTPLHVALLMNLSTPNISNIVRQLLQHKANIFRKNKMGQTPLHLAALNNHLDSARLIIEIYLLNRRSLNDRDNEGRTPLMAAVFMRHTQMIKMLLAYGASNRIRNKSNRRASDIAYAIRRPDIGNYIRDGRGLEDVVATRIAPTIVYEAPTARLVISLSPFITH